MKLAELLLATGLAVLALSCAMFHVTLVGLLAIPGFLFALGLLFAAGFRLAFDRPKDRPVAVGAALYGVAMACVVVASAMAGMMGYRIAISSLRPGLVASTPGAEIAAVVALAGIAGVCLHGSLARFTGLTSARRAFWGVVVALLPAISAILVIILAQLIPVSA